MQTIITQRLGELKRQQANVQQELEQVAARQQALLQDHIGLTRAIRELETIVVALPTSVDGLLPVAVPPGT